MPALFVDVDLKSTLGEVHSDGNLIVLNEGKSVAAKENDDNESGREKRNGGGDLHSDNILLAANHMLDYPAFSTGYIYYSFTNSYKISTA